MGILDIQKKVEAAIKDSKGSTRNNEGAVEMIRSLYQPTTEEKDAILTVIKNFANG